MTEKEAIKWQEAYENVIRPAIKGKGGVNE